MRDVRVLPGVMVGSAAIGPVVALGGAMIAAFGGAGVEALWIAPFLCLAALPVGFAVSLLPNLIGATLLGWLGRGNIGVRLPVMWALAGAGTAAALMLPFGQHRPDAEPAAVMVAIGAVSALLCRWKISWTDSETSAAKPCPVAPPPGIGTP